MKEPKKTVMTCSIKYAQIVEGVLTQQPPCAVKNKLHRQPTRQHRLAKKMKNLVKTP